MAAVRALLARVTRLEQSEAPAASPFGSFEAWAASAQADIDAGLLDPRDGPVLIAAVERWHTDEVWGLWQ